jgi:branched-chain amino acid transport system substrate-binding protein
MNRLFRLVVLSLGVLLLIGLACRPAAAPAPKPAPPAPAPAPAPKPGPPAGAPAELKVALVDFLSGPAAKFGTAALNGMKLLFDETNEAGGIGGVKVRYIVVDEAGPVEKNYTYVFRTSAHQAAENVAAAYYVLKVKPDVKTIAGINDDYAWGRDSWEAFMRAILKLKPDVKVVDALWPRLYQGEYSAEITKLLAAKPDVIHSSLWGGHMDAFIQQAAARGLFKESLVLLTTGETALLTLKEVPEGVGLTGRGHVVYTVPDPAENPLTKKFIESYEARYGEHPIYPSFRGAQAVSAFIAAYEKAIKTAGRWPTKEEVIKALENLEFDSPGGRIKMALGNGHQAIQPSVWGITSSKRHPKWGFPLLEKMETFPAEQVNPPPGVKTLEWIETLRPAAR